MSGNGAALKAGELRARLETSHFGVEDDPACRAKALAGVQQFDERGFASLIGNAGETIGFFRGSLRRLRSGNPRLSGRNLRPGPEGFGNRIVAGPAPICSVGVVFPLARG